MAASQRYMHGRAWRGKEPCTAREPGFFDAAVGRSLAIALPALGKASLPVNRGKCPPRSQLRAKFAPVGRVFWSVVAKWAGVLPGRMLPSVSLARYTVRHLRELAAP